MKEVFIISTYDNTKQPSLIYTVDKAAPLVVGLHSWSCDKTNQIENFLPMAKRNNWHLILPEFRGPNLRINPTPQLACGSKAAKQDIVDAVNYMIQNYKVNADNILLAGGSGGGHMALLMAGYRPKIWKAVCSFCPLTDVERWYYELYDVYEKTGGSKSYVKGIEACLDGAPCDDNIADYMYRSPISHIHKIARANVKIFHGKSDKSISYLHSLDFFNLVVSKYPDSRIFLDIFDGPHEMYPKTVEKWFKLQLHIENR